MMKLFLTSWPSGELIPVKILGKSKHKENGIYIEYPSGGTDTTTPHFLFDIPNNLASQTTNWISVNDELPKIGQPIILFGNNVVQEEIYRLDAVDLDDYHTDYFWSREEIDEDIENETVPIDPAQMWTPLPKPPEQK